MYIQYVLHVMFVINEAARDACQLCSYILVSMQLHDVCHNMKLQEMSCLNLHVMSVTYAVTFLSVCSYMIPAMYAATRDACHVCSYSWCLSRIQLHVMPVMNAATRDACHGCSCTWCLSWMQLHVMPVMYASTRDACHVCSYTWCLSWMQVRNLSLLPHTSYLSPDMYIFFLMTPRPGRVGGAVCGVFTFASLENSQCKQKAVLYTHIRTPQPKLHTPHGIRNLPLPNSG